MTIYGPVDGAHISKAEAQIIGEGREKLQAKLNRENFSTAEFERFCKDKTQQIHPIWLKKKKEIVSGAGRAAAAYLLRSIVTISGVGQPTGRTVILLHTETKQHQSAATVYSPQQVAADAELLRIQEENLKTTVRAAIKEFAGGVTRMKRAIQSVMNEFDDWDDEGEQPPNPAHQRHRTQRNKANLEQNVI